MSLKVQIWCVGTEGLTSPAFYTHRTRTSTVFVKKRIKLRSVACQLLKKKVQVSSTHHSFCVCVNFIRGWRDLQFEVDSERQIFRETFHVNFIYSQSFFQKPTERKSPKKYFSYLNGWWLTGIRTQSFEYNKPTHYILDHGDFIIIVN